MWFSYLLCLALLSRQGISFSVHRQRHQLIPSASKLSCPRSLYHRKLPRLNDAAARILAESSESVATEMAIQDKNGRSITVGSVVRVMAESVKAYQITPKGQGSYDENKKFVPRKDGDGGKYLVLPVGLRGSVTKVYDVHEISANFPIQVKFIPGQNVEEGYDPPLAFLMHFTTQEIECVES